MQAVVGIQQLIVLFKICVSHSKRSKSYRDSTALSELVLRYCFIVKCPLQSSVFSLLSHDLVQRIVIEISLLQFPPRVTLFLGKSVQHDGF